MQALVQAKRVYPGGVAAFASNVTAGNAILLFAGTGLATTTKINEFATPTDSRGNTYRLITTLHWFDTGTYPQVSNRIAVWIATNVAAGATTITVVDPGTDLGVTAYELSGVHPSYPVNTVGGRVQGGASTPFTVTVTPSAQCSLYCYLLEEAPPHNFSSFTAGLTNNGGNSSHTDRDGSRFGVGAGSYDVGVNLSATTSNSNSGIVAIALNDAEYARLPGGSTSGRTVFPIVKFRRAPLPLFDEDEILRPPLTIKDDDYSYAPTALLQQLPPRPPALYDGDEILAPLANFASEQEDAFIARMTAAPWLDVPFTDDEILPLLSLLYLDQEEPWVGQVTVSAWHDVPFRDDEAAAILLVDQEEPWVGQVTVSAWHDVPFRDDEAAAILLVDQEEPWVGQVTVSSWTAVPFRCLPYFPDELLVRSGLAEDDWCMPTTAAAVAWLSSAPRPLTWDDATGVIIVGTPLWPGGGLFLRSGPIGSFERSGLVGGFERGGAVGTFQRKRAET